MAFTSGCHWEVRPTGSDTNPGGFDCGVSGFPTDGAATVATGTAPVFTSASYTFVAGDVGAWIFIRSGTNWKFGFYRIVSVSAGAATLDATIGTVPRMLVRTDGSYGVLEIWSTAGCATVASPTSATWGIDYSQQDAAKIAFTDLVIGGTTTQFTSVANPVGKNFVGNTINITSGTGFTVQRVAIVSTSGTTATCDKSLGTGASTGGTGNLGGAAASPGWGTGAFGNANNCFIKTGTTYLMTSTTLGASGGRVNGAFACRVEGFQTVRGDRGARAVIKASGISTASMCSGSSQCKVINIELDGDSLTAIRGFDLGSGHVFNCVAKNMTNSGFVGGGVVEYCRATGCSTAGAAFLTGGRYRFCVADANTVPGWDTSNTTLAMHCMAVNNTGATTDGFRFGSIGAGVNLTAYGNGRHGIAVANGDVSIYDVVVVNNGGWGISQNAAAECRLFNLFGYNNTSGDFNFTGMSAYWVGPYTSLTASPFVDPANGDYRLNAVSGGGASLRAAVTPNDFPGFPNTIGYLDVGAVQSLPPFRYPGMHGGVM